MHVSGKGYHPYVFDPAARQFVGRFEDMYRAESGEGFDSWHQDDLRNLSKQVALTVLAQYSFSRVLDLGCGKGAFTQFLKRQNTEVVAVDLSETALGVARARYPDIAFVHADVAVPGFDWATLGVDFDLVVTLETLSYIESWRRLLAQLARIARFALVVLYLPDDPIGFIKSFDDLVGEFGSHFSIIEDVRLQSHRQIVLFGASRPKG